MPTIPALIASDALDGASHDGRAARATSSTGSVHIRRDKAGDGRWTVLSPEALRIVHALKRRKIASPLVFCTPFGKSLRTNFQRVWETARRRAKIANFRFHDLRHTFASRLTQKGVDS